ncbi:CoA-binding protein [Mesorhizobium sp. SARCC-RB16n]|uniref:CoA-binding protein n=1 Tax=Mesorhizobium sp. SARCC-RB16n TaxID=2116687 RepID=UPI00358F30C7
MEYCRARGFDGRMYVVSPRRSELGGLPCFSSVASLPEMPDVAYVAVPRENVLIRELSQFGVAGAIVNTSAFSENARWSALPRRPDSGSRRHGL